MPSQGRGVWLCGCVAVLSATLHLDLRTCPLHAHIDVWPALPIRRPPGHHAEPDKAMGYCLFNNIAIAAKHALENR